MQGQFCVEDEEEEIGIVLMTELGEVSADGETVSGWEIAGGRASRRISMLFDMFGFRLGILMNSFLLIAVTSVLRFFTT